MANDRKGATARARFAIHDGSIAPEPVVRRRGFQFMTSIQSRHNALHRSKPEWRLARRAKSSLDGAKLSKCPVVRSFSLGSAALAGLLIPTKSPADSEMMSPGDTR
jgi:hypothetical protein